MYAKTAVAGLKHQPSTAVFLTVQINIFQIKAGDQLLLLGDENQGLALLDPNFFLETPKYFSEK